MPLSPTSRLRLSGTWARRARIRSTVSSMFTMLWKQSSSCRKPDRQGGPLTRQALPDGRASDTSRPHTRNVQSDAIKTRTRAEIQSLAVGIAPGHVVRVFWRDDRAEVFTFRRDYPQAARR